MLGIIFGELIVLEFFSDADLAIGLGVESILKQSKGNEQVGEPIEAQCMHTKPSTTFVEYIALNLSMSSRTDLIVML